MHQVQQSLLSKAEKDAVFPLTGPSVVMVSGLPWGMGLSHPHEVHVAGQQGELRHGLGVVRTAEVTVGQQDIDDQLQVGLPSNRLPE